MQIKEIVRMMINNEQDFFLTRSLITSEHAGIITRRLNESFHQNLDIQDTVVALSLLPALLWAQKGRVITSVIGNASKTDGDIMRLTNVQAIITNATGMKTSLFLDNRKKYFDACDELINHLMDAIDNIGHYPELGYEYKQILLLFTNDADKIKTKGRKVTKYSVNKHLPTALAILHEDNGERISELLDKILTSRQQDEDETAYLYHNTAALLKEYNRILWKAKYSNDYAMQLLQCKSTQEMLRLTDNDEKYRQTFVIVEYIKFISGAVEMVKEFPENGKDYYDILKAIIEMKPKKVADLAIADSLNMSAWMFSIKRRKALTVLSALLWGCDSDAFMRLMQDKN